MAILRLFLIHVEKALLSIKVAGADAKVLEDSNLVQLSCASRAAVPTAARKARPSFSIPTNSDDLQERSMSYEDLLDIVETDVRRVSRLSCCRVILPAISGRRGCSIYRARPLACSSIRWEGSSIMDAHISYCPISMSAPACHRHRQDRCRLSQGTGHQMLIQMADHWIDFVSEMERLPLSDKPVTSIAFHMLVYSPDTPPAPTGTCRSIDLD